MKVSILVITHDEIGSSLVGAATKTLGELPLPTTTVAVDYDTEPEVLKEKLERVLKLLEHGDGILILTDIYGSTPSNIAQALSQNYHARLVSGLNLPMLIRIMNYPDLELDELADKAISGGRDGVRNCEIKEAKNAS